MASQTPSTAMVDDPGIWFGISTGLVVLCFFVTALAGLAPAATAFAVLLVAGLSAARLPGPIALALGVVAWAFFTGFTENDFGQLTFAAGDLVRLGSFAVSTAVLGYLVRTLVGRDEVRRG